MFEQQVHMWRWTGNVTHEKLLRPGLELHASWAHDSFDADSNGLYHSYVNTWPTDAVYYNGGESVEEVSEPSCRPHFIILCGRNDAC